MRQKRADFAIKLIRRGFAAKSATSHEINGERRLISRRPPIDLSSIRDVDDATRLFRQMLNMSTNCNSGFQPSLRIYNNFFSVLVKLEEYSVALSLFDEMRQLGLPVNEYTFNIMINCCCLLNHVGLGFAMLGSLFKQDLKPNVVTFNTLLKGLFIVGKVAEAHILLKKVLSFRLCEINDATILTVINGLCKSGQTRTAHDLLLVLEKGRLKPNISAYNALIDAYCKDGLVDEALQLLFKMMDTGISPDVITYNSIIQGLCSLDRWNEVKYLLLVEMIDHKVPLDVVGFNILVDAFCKKGKMKEADDILETMIRVNVSNSPNIVTYNTLLAGYCREGRMDKAKQVFDSIAEAGFKPCIISFNSLINGYCKSRNMDEAWRLFHEIHRTGLKHNIFSYNSMIHGFCVEGRSADGWKLFNDMEARQLHPTLRTYNILLDGLCRNLQTAEAFSFLSMIESKGVKPNIVTYNILINGFCQTGKLDVARNIFNQLTSKGLQPDVKTYNMIIGSLYREGLDEEGRCLLLQMDKSGCAPNSVTYNVIVRRLLKRKEVKKAMPFLEEMYVRGLYADPATTCLLLDQLHGEDLWLPFKVGAFQGWWLQRLWLHTTHVHTILVHTIHVHTHVLLPPSVHSIHNTATLSELMSEFRAGPPSSLLTKVQDLERELATACSKEKEQEATISKLTHKNKVVSARCSSYEKRLVAFEAESKKTKEELLVANKKYSGARAAGYAEGLEKFPNTEQGRIFLQKFWEDEKAKWLKSVEFLNHLTEGSLQYFDYGFDSCQKQAELHGFAGLLNKDVALQEAPELKESGL